MSSCPLQLLRHYFAAVIGVKQCHLQLAHKCLGVPFFSRGIRLTPNMHLAPYRYCDSSAYRMKSFNLVISTFVVSLLFLAACNHASEEQKLLGVWEGFIPLPATGEEVPIKYVFTDDSLDVFVGQPGSETERHWNEWEISRVEQGDWIIHVHGGGRVYATIIREIGDDHLKLWDAGLDISTAAEVWRSDVENEPESDD